MTRRSRASPHSSSMVSRCAMIVPTVSREPHVPGQEAQPDEIVPSLAFAFAPLDKTALGIACALVGGLIVYLATAILILTYRQGPLGPNLSLLRQFFLGYSVSWQGAIVGLLWGSAVGFVAGWLFALVRNFTLALYLFFIKTQAEVDQYRDFLDHI